MLNAKFTLISWIRNLVSRRRVCIRKILFLIQLWSRDYKVLNLQVYSDFTVLKLVYRSQNDVSEMLVSFWDPFDDLLLFIIICGNWLFIVQPRFSQIQTEHFRKEKRPKQNLKDAVVSIGSIVVMLDDAIKRPNEKLLRVCLLAWNSFLFRSLPFGHFQCATKFNAHSTDVGLQIRTNCFAICVLNWATHQSRRTGQHKNEKNQE